MASTSRRCWSTILSRVRAKERWRYGLGTERSHTSLTCASRNDVERVLNTQYRLDLDPRLPNRGHCVRDFAQTTWRRSVGAAGLDHRLRRPRCPLHLRVPVLSCVES